MVEKIGTYIGATSLRTCLGDKSQTAAAMRCGESGLKYSDSYSMYVGIAEVELVEGFTRFESLMIEQIANVLAQTSISLADGDVQLIISTTKGNVELLGGSEEIAEEAFVYTSAEAIANHFGAVNKPIVISNACISGVSAFVVAKEMMKA